MSGFFRFLRKWQEKRQIDLARVPKHIGIIMDGNGRWAKAHALPRSAGHRKGAETLEKIITYCDSVGVKAITAYAFSTENWSRPKSEVDALMDLLFEYLQQAEERFAGKNVVLRVIGDRSALRRDIQAAIKHAEEITAANNGIVLNMAINYGGQSEIVHAAQVAAEKVSAGEIFPENITERFFDGLMYTADSPPVDLIIRPSGELRLSNFLLWQAAYAEFWFSQINWPDFSEQDMEQAILDFQSRDRRFGKV